MLFIPFAPESVKAACFVVWLFGFVLALFIFNPMPKLPATEDIVKDIREKHQRTQIFEQTLQMSCKHLTRLSSVVVTCRQCGERFLKVENTPTVSCPGCGRAVFRHREPSGICGIDGSRVSKEQLTKCLNLDGKGACECPKIEAQNAR